MLIPWNASPPNYSGQPTSNHFPWATLGLIVVNIAVFAATGMGSDESLSRWGLEYGNGLHPLQWVTRNFLHLGPVHLIGNMLFLWVFGLVIEGKLGWWKFLVVYLGLAVFQAGIEQALSFWFDHGRSVGASGVIFALLAMALVWAPDHEIHCLWIYSGFFRWGATDIEISILWMAIFYIGTNLFFAGIRGLGMSSEMLHSLGALLGLALGFIMLKLKWVDCEGWDLLTVMSGGHLRSAARPEWFRRGGSRKKKREHTSEADTPESAADRFLRNQEQFRKFLAERKGSAALALYEKTKHQTGTWELHEKELLQLVERLCAEKQFNDAVPFLEEYLRRFEKRAIEARLKLAQLLIEHQQRPSYASRVLAELPAAGLSEAYQKLRKALERKAQAMIDDGVLELEGRAW
jgi:membrane associated rhomboid family serine protease